MKNKASVVTYWIPPDWSKNGDTFVFFATVVEKFAEVYVNITNTYTIGNQFGWLRHYAKMMLL